MDKNGQKITLNVVCSRDPEDTKWWIAEADATIGFRAEGSDEWAEVTVVTKILDTDPDVAFTSAMSVLLEQVIADDVNAILNKELENLQTTA